MRFRCRRGAGLQWVDEIVHVVEDRSIVDMILAGSRCTEVGPASLGWLEVLVPSFKLDVEPTPPLVTPLEHAERPFVEHFMLQG